MSLAKPMMLHYDHAPARLGLHNATLIAGLIVWHDRDDSRPEPEARRAASIAVDMIDTMLAELHSLRGRLIAETRAADDATDARVDTLLGHPGGPDE